MKKLAFISLAILGFGGVNEIAKGMNPPDEGQCSQSNCNQKEIKLKKSDKGKENLEKIQKTKLEKIQEMQNMHQELCNIQEELKVLAEKNPEGIQNNIEDMNAKIKGFDERIRELVSKIYGISEDIRGLNNLEEEAKRIRQLEETLSPEEKEKMRQYEEIEKHRPVCCLPRPTPITPKEAALRQVCAEAREKARLKEQISKINLEIKKLERERDKWSAYIDGRRKLPERMAGPFFEKEKQEFEQRIKRAPDIIADIDSRISKLKAFLGHF